VWGAKEQRRRRGERKYSVVLTTELSKTTFQCATTLPVCRRARTRGSESELLIDVACELLIEMTCELLIEVDLENSMAQDGVKKETKIPAYHTKAGSEKT
jgi:hypothetical protein